jgi:hypothetical protein
MSADSRIRQSYLLCDCLSRNLISSRAQVHAVQIDRILDATKDVPQEKNSLWLRRVAALLEIWESPPDSGFPIFFEKSQRLLAKDHDRLPNPHFEIVGFAYHFGHLQIPLEVIYCRPGS